MEEKIEKLIRSIGIFRIKAKSVYNLSKTLVEKYNGKVQKLLKTEELPGVGHKTASVVMSQGLSAFPIDIIYRLEVGV